MKPKLVPFPSVNTAAPEDIGCIDRGWISLDDPRYFPTGIWRIPACLRFKKGSPFPSILHLSFDQQMERTKDLLGETFSEVIKLTGARCIDILYAPGGVGREIVPMGVLEVQAPGQVVREIVDAIQCVLDLEKLYAYKDSSTPDGIFALDIVQLRGSNLADDLFVDRFTMEVSHAIPGIGSSFATLKVNRLPGIRIYNLKRTWTPEDFQAIHSAVNDLSVREGIGTALDRLLVWEPLGISQWRVENEKSWRGFA